MTKTNYRAFELSAVTYTHVSQADWDPRGWRPATHARLVIHEGRCPRPQGLGACECNETDIRPLGPKQGAIR
jgi:hypothetical protein